MGAHMIARLAAAGIEVVANDVDQEHLRPLAALDGVSVAPALSDLGELDLVILMLPSTAIVEAVVTGPGGLLSAMGRGSLIIDMGSSDPRSTVALARRTASAGIGFVDGPVSGGLAGARTGRLTIMFGGESAQLERCRPLFDAIGDQVVEVGPVGSGHAIKALNNLLSAEGLAAATEIIEVGRRFGLDPHVMLKAINASTGRNHATETKVEQFVLSDTFASGFALRLMLKDIATAVDLAHDQGVPIPLGDACLSLWERAASELPADADQTRIGLMPRAAAVSQGSARP
ncbi:MAG: 3-hydroxyisobutyrate dehydrogenase [Chloroflexota bacterium]|jgi:3-hydroxyisobutyrate dehydrogenase|nr:3-hydroxyisobutyrate dehydrogenase [Chloroflexota bacterium]